jgi:hypothetical protein
MVSEKTSEGVATYKRDGESARLSILRHALLAPSDFQLLA